MDSTRRQIGVHLRYVVKLEKITILRNFARSGRTLAGFIDL